MVDVKRRYDGSRRQQQAAQRRLRMLAEARRLLLERGYADTTLALVADRAGVATPTAYKAFGNKAGLVKAVIDYSIAGDDDPTPLLRRERAERIRSEPDPARKIELYADGLIATLKRSGRLQLVIRMAAESQSEIRPVWKRMQQERLAGMTHLAKVFADGGHLGANVSADTARDILWAQTSPELYQLFVLERRWSLKRYRDWLVTTLTAALLR